MGRLFTPSLEQQNDIIKLYTIDKLTSDEISKKYKISSDCLLRFLRRNNIEIDRFRCKNIRKSKYTLNHYYFDIIDDEHKAYWLGFLYADGYHQENRYRIRLSIQEKDGYILEKFRKDINSNKPIKTEKPRNINWQNMKTVQFASKYLSARLKELGIYQNKSFTVRFPTEKQIPIPLIRHFIRGYFDGDGCIYHNPIYKTYRLSFVGSIFFTDSLSKLITETHSVRTSLEAKTNNKNQTIQSVNIKAKNSVKLVLNWMYKDATIYLHRKYNKCKEFNLID